MVVSSQRRWIGQILCLTTLLLFGFPGQHVREAEADQERHPKQAGSEGPTQPIGRQEQRRITKLVEDAPLIVSGEIVHTNRLRGMGGGITASYTLRIDRIIQGTEKASDISFGLQLTPHRSEVETWKPREDPADTKGRILAVLKQRRDNVDTLEGEADVWYSLASVENEAWWPADSSAARFVNVLILEKPNPGEK